MPLLEKQSQNRVRHTGISNSIAVHNSRDDFSSVLIDSSFNGFSFISDVNDPLAWKPNAGFVLTYRRFHGSQNSSGIIGVAQSQDGEEWFDQSYLNDCYPTGDCEPNLPTYNGLQVGRYPSSFISGNEDNNIANVIWNEYTNSQLGGGNAGGYPLYTYNSLGMGEDMYWPDPIAVNTGCSILPCDPADLWLPNVQEIRLDGSSIVNILFQQGISPFMMLEPESFLPLPSSYYWIRSNFFTNGYILWNDPMLLFDFSDNEIISEYAGRPRFHINDNGVGYFVFSGYGEGYDSEGSLQSHTFFILKTTNYGETWEPIGETFNNGSFGFISDDILNQSMLNAGLLGGTVQDSIGNDVTLDQAFMGYHYQVFTDEYDELHIITTALPKNSGSDSLYVGSSGAGYYHLHNSDPSNPGNWNATMIRDMSDSYKVQIHPQFPTWQYLYADIAISYTGGTIWTVTSAIRELIPMGDNEYTYDDLDLFGSVSLDNGVSWGDFGNLTDTPSGGAFGLNVELHPHLAPLADIGECFLTFQMPASEDDEYDAVMNRIYFATIGLESLSGGGTIKINEIMQNPSAVADDFGEWFEIVNDGNLPINLFGYSIKDAGTDMHTIDDAIVLFPGQFKVFGNNSNPDANGGVTVDYQYSDVSLGNGSDELIILDRDGMMTDSVAWDNGVTFPNPNGASMALLDTSLDNSMGSNWQESTTLYGDGDFGTPGIPNFSSDIALDLTSLDFGGVMDGLTGTSLLHVYNLGETALEIDTVYCTGNFSVIPGNGIVDAGDTLSLEVTFAPDDETSFDGTLTIVAGNDPDEDTLTVSLLGDGTPQAPIMELSNDSLYFGAVVAGQAVTRQTTIYNTGMLDLEVEELNITGSELFTTTFSDATIEPGDSVDVVFQFAPTEQITEATATVTVVVSGIENQTITLYAGEVLSTESNFIPSQYILYQNHPNPFNPVTTLRYDLPEDALVSIDIYDLMGRNIRSLVNSNQSAGYRSIQWNATNNLGESVSAGMYIYTIQAGEFRQTKKMVLLK